MGKDAGRLADDTRALLAATADVAGDQVDAIRKRLTDALKYEKKVYDGACDRVVAGGRALDKAMHTSPYQTAAIGIGCGVLIGFFMARKMVCHESKC